MVQSDWGFQIIAANVGWLIYSVILVTIFSILPTEGPFSGLSETLWMVWIAATGIIGLADFRLILSVFESDF